MSLNPQKSKYMIVSNRQKQHNTQLYLANNILEEVETFKYLGIFIDSNLKFQSHIDHIHAKLSRLCGITYRLKYHLNLESAKNVYYACVYSVVSYALAVFGGILMCTHRGDSLMKLQLRIIKNLFSRFFPNNPCLFREIRILNFRDIYVLKVGLYMFRIMILNEYPLLREHLALEFPQHEHYTRSITEPRLPLPRVEVVRMNFRYQFIKVWNDLPDIIKNSERLTTFKRRLIDFLIAKY